MFFRIILTIIITSFLIFGISNLKRLGINLLNFKKESTSNIIKNSDLKEINNDNVDNKSKEDLSIKIQDLKINENVNILNDNNLDNIKLNLKKKIINETKKNLNILKYKNKKSFKTNDLFTIIEISSEKENI